MSRSDIQCRRDIEEELRGDSTVNAAQSAVTLDQGAVSLLDLLLLDTVYTCPQK